MIVKDNGKQIIIHTPDFHFDEYYSYLNRNQNEVLHELDYDKKTITKAIHLTGESFLIQIKAEKEHLVVSFPMSIPAKKTRLAAADYIIDWFDLEKNLEPFYKMAAKDMVLWNVVQKHKGLRIIGVPDLFEALCWTIIGQQISLHVAYLLKKRFVEKFGETIVWNSKTYWIFPEAEKISTLSKEAIISLKLTQKKAEYILGAAALIQSGQLSKELLLSAKTLAAMEKQLVSIRGIGSWSANYILMRCLRQADAFPLADVGLHNALKHVLGREEKPSIREIERLANNWHGWKAYATFYLWRSIQ